jgi:hypothetical protein
VLAGDGALSVLELLLADDHSRRGSGGGGNSSLSGTTLVTANTSGTSTSPNRDLRIHDVAR